MTLRTARAATLVIAVLTLVACGKRGNPVAPQLRAPQVVNDLRATARHDGIELAWTPPRRRVDNSRLLDPAMVTKLYRTEDSGAGEPRAAMLVKDRIAGYTEIATLPPPAVPGGEAREPRMVYTDRRDLTFGRRYTYVVTTDDTRGHVSRPSARASVTFIAAPEAPTALGAEPGDAEVHLVWQAPPRLVDGSTMTGPLVYEIARASDATSTPTAIGKTAPGETSFVDRGITNDVTYHYTVRAIRTDAGAAAVSAASTPVTATPVKSTPPVPASDLAAIPSRGEVRLSWKPSPAPDVGAYVIYRATGSGPFIRIGSVRPPATTFVDREVPPGQYRYAVTAQDASTRANESAQSNEVTVAVP